MKVVSHEELKKHNSEGDVWMAIHGLVYDVSKFMPDHPGGHTRLPSELSKHEPCVAETRSSPGAHLLQDVAGKDASGEFEAHPLVGVRAMPCTALVSLVQDALHSEQARAEEAIILKGMFGGL